MKTNAIPVKLIFLIAVIFVGHTTSVKSQVLIEDTYVEASTIVQDLDTPWEILWGPDDWIWMTERNGRISRANPETGELQVLIEINEVNEFGEGGLLGMVLHPDFQDSSYVYVVYNYGSAQQYREKLVRYTYEDETLTDPFVLLDDIDATFIHNGSRLIIDENYKLFMTTGDASDEPQAQDVGSINGKILRMNLDGGIPDDNPIAGSYVWSWGHRNPQGMVQLPNDTLYISEHGPDTDDEVSIILKGRNYGWPNVRGFCEGDENDFCNDSNVVEPIAAWTPTLAVCGLDYYNHDAIPEWSHSLLMTNLKNSSLVAMKLNEKGDEILEENVYFRNDYGRLRDLCIAPDGRVFIATSNRDGRGNDPFPIQNDDRIIEIKATTDPTSVSEVSSNSSVKIFPNPVDQHLNVKLNHLEDHVLIKIINHAGQEIWQNEMSKSQETIDLSFLRPGVYQMQIMGKQNAIHKLLIKK